MYTAKLNKAIVLFHQIFYKKVEWRIRSRPTHVCLEGKFSRDLDRYAHRKCGTQHKYIATRNDLLIPDITEKHFIERRR